jgi:uncharacterized protein
MNKENRFVSVDCQPAKIEERENGQRWLVGYAAVHFRDGSPGTEYELRPDVVERMQPGAFNRSIESGGDIIALFNHDPAMLLGRRSNGTLSVTVDQVGVRYAVPLNPVDPDHQRVQAKIDRGDLSGSSFTFDVPPGGQKWTKRPDGKWQRDIMQAKVVELGPVTMPAYAATSAGLRSLDNPIEALAAMQQEEMKIRAREVKTRLRLIEIQ